MEETIAALEVERLTQSSESDELKNLQAAKNELQTMKKDHAREKKLEEQVKLLERKLSAKSREQQQQIEELEASVEQFRHEMHISDQSIEAKELSAMHEK
ncbi:hypothetical protein PsorP6_007007 [Peronosclerospora sorghi]|uniref:Uncharacterized protein n=1 Tax=Peronosclerospora sorghi TaxID=230839 RepID=A0ACC0W8S1_9STRA|nr:hypothetical protein PsorP6_007007 [Peronosclerospora sorghi]